jgi:hypothetical protein
LYSQSNKTKKDALRSTKFISAYDGLIDNNRKLFDIPPIDEFFCFHDKKSMSIINRCKTAQLLYHLIAKLCIEHSKDNENHKTILIDGGGNNLGYLYAGLTKLSVKERFNTNQLLGSIMLSRAFTFYQLANVIINELPPLVQKLNCKTQIIVLDIFDTLFSPLANRLKPKLTKNASDINEDKIKLLGEILQGIVDFSKHGFSILAFTDFSNMFDKSIFSHFNQILEIVSAPYDDEKNSGRTILHMRTSHAKKSLTLDSILEVVQQRETQVAEPLSLLDH